MRDADGDRTAWVLGDQLTTQVGPLADDVDRVLLVEAWGFARRHPYHPHKLTLLFSAMRHFRDRLRDAGYDVEYHQCETFGDGLDAYFDAHPGDTLVTMRPASHRSEERLRELVDERGGTLDVRENDLFLVGADEFDAWADDHARESTTPSGGDERFVHEDFYRYVRRRTGYLMEDGEPVGGQWNYDERNRETPPPDYDPPSPPRFEPDETTRETASWVRAEFEDQVCWTEPEPFFWPVTREEALDALDDFVSERLPEFGPYQDAMVEDEWAMNHSLLSPAINLGLLHVTEVVERAIDAYEDGTVSIESVEGFVRQLVGWREFVRHVYRRTMPDLVRANQFDADHALPMGYWTGETKMACLEAAVEGVRERGYAHHTQRLMVLSNLATTFGVSPQELNEWFHAGFVDAYHWVTTPNVVGMGTFATDVLSTKPYVSAANYVRKMSDHCADCRYDPSRTTGESACPFNALYWDFLGRHESTLRGSGRVGPVYGHWDRKDDEERAAIRRRAAEIRQKARDGDL